MSEKKLCFNCGKEFESTDPYETLCPQCRREREEDNSAYGFFLWGFLDG